MDMYIKRFMKELLDNKENLNQYIDDLYSLEYKRNDLNEMFGLLKEEGYISCIYADNRVYNATLTLKGKCLTDVQ